MSDRIAHARREFKPRCVCGHDYHDHLPSDEGCWGRWLGVGRGFTGCSCEAYQADRSLIAAIAEVRFHAGALLRDVRRSLAR